MQKRNFASVGFGCGFLLLCLLSIGTYWQLRGLSNTENPGDYGFIEIEVPPHSPIGESYSLLISVQKNFGNLNNLTLHSIDLSESYLRGVTLLDISPVPEEELTLPLVGFHSFIFNQEIEQGETAVIEFRLQGRQAAELTGLVDVCLNTAALCQRFNLQTTITAGN